MSGVLVVAEHRRGELRDITFELIAAARDLKAAGAGTVTVAVVGSNVEAVVSAVTRDGVDEVVVARTTAEHFEPHLTQRALEALIEQRVPAVLLAGHTVDGYGFAPALAASNGFAFASNVLSVGWDNGALSARRAVYSDRLVAELAFDRPTAVLMIRSGAYAATPAATPAATEASGAVPVRMLGGDFGPARAIHHGFRDVDSDDVDITTSDFLLSIGRGIGERDNVERFAALAEKLGATLSSSRPLVDAGWVPSARQVGQSGRTVKPKVYLAMGISGAIQHLNGIREAQIVIAVNTDPDAPIFSVASYGAVVDVHELADALDQIA
jgi:electron transfer flavoprotein alpha subunit